MQKTYDKILSKIEIKNKKGLKRGQLTISHLESPINKGKFSGFKSRSEYKAFHRNMEGFFFEFYFKT
jgi:hypothetical protein